MKQKIKVKSVPMAENGIQVYEGGGAIPISYNPYDNGTIQFHGRSHDDGGIKMSYGENPLEVEGSETAFIGNDNQLTVLGNLRIPGLDKKFKTAGKDIAEAEVRAGKQLDKSTDLLNTSNPFNKYEAFTFNSGRMMQEGAKLKQKDLAQQKEDLATIQNWMLDTANSTGMEPKEISKMLKNGGSIPTYADGGTTGDDNAAPTQSVAVRHNNPGNIKYAPWQQKYGAIPGEVSTDGGRFAKFPDTASGLQAMQVLLKSPTYNNLTVKQAIKKWTGGTGYNINIGPIADKKVGELAPDEFNTLKNTITYGEDGKYYNTAGMQNNPINLEEVNVKPAISGNFGPSPNEDLYRPIGPEGNRAQIQGPTAVEINARNDANNFFKQGNSQGLQTVTVKKMPSLADRNKLGISEILPELAGLAERPTPVAHQQYNPQLFTPYNVSFQDRLNENNASFKSLESQVKSNPSALAALAGQKYAADNAVLADQFRTNQGIQNDVANKNIALLNDAKLKNLQLADTAYQRQTAAETYTKQHQREALASLAAKIEQNKRENNLIRLEENRFNYRLNPTTGQMEYVGPDANWSTGVAQGYNNYGSNNPNARTETQYDPETGKVIGIKTITYGANRDSKEYYQSQIDKEKASRMNSQKYGGKTPIKLKKKTKK